MKPAAEQFATALEQTAIEMPRIPVLQNVGAKAAADVSELRQALTEQLYESVQWTKTLQFLQDEGVEYIVECGPGTGQYGKTFTKYRKALPLDTQSRLEDALNTVLVAEGKLHDTGT